MTMRNSATTRGWRYLATIGALGLALAACGGGDDESTATTSPAAAEPDGGSDTTDGGASNDAGDGGGTTTMSATTEPAVGSIGDFTPGDVSYRVVNLLDEPVDLYGRTQGFVEAYLLEAGVAPNAITEFYAAPADGRFLVTEAGATDVTCVTTCPEFIAELSPWGDDGPAHTVLLHPLDGERSAFDLWEAPDASAAGSGNAMPAPDSSSGIVVVPAIAVTDNDWGLRLGIDGVPGCQDPANDSGVLVGGNQTPPFTYDGDSADISIYANEDRECAEAPIGGPFTITGGPGARSHLFLTGSLDALDGVVLPMEGDMPAVGGGGTDSGEAGGDDSDRGLALDGITDSLIDELGLDADTASCVAEYVVDEMGVELLVVDGEFVDLDSLPASAEQTAAVALEASIEPCELDPSLFG